MQVFNQIWIDNRFKNRKSMKGSSLKVDEETGYLEPANKRGFDGRRKAIFIERYTVCRNQRAICRSIGVDIQAVYDAIALDKKFREDFSRCDQILKRSTRLNDEMLKLTVVEKQTVVNNLLSKIDKYK